jgi:Strictosidine synthase-like, N-terminal/Strictosidine synthase
VRVATSGDGSRRSRHPEARSAAATRSRGALRTVLAISVGATTLAMGATAVWLGVRAAPIQALRLAVPPRPALEGVLAPDHVLSGCERIGAGVIRGPEDIKIDEQGRVYAGTSDGVIVRVDPRGGPPRVERFAEPGGRPTGLSFDGDGNLLVSDGYDRPDALVDAAGRVVPVPQRRSASTAVARDGRVFFSTLPSWDHTGDRDLDFFRMMLEARPVGELRVQDPATGSVRVLLTGLYIPEGVVLSEDEDFVVVAEWLGYRLTRHWLTGPKAGTTDRLVENLPGTPDGLVSDGRGRLYVALPVLRSAVLDWLQYHPLVKDQVAKVLSPWLARRLAVDPPGGGRGMVVVVDERDGRITGALYDAEGRLGSGLSTAVPYAGWLYVGSVFGDGITRCRLPPD